jgi:hypothetical protein
MTTIEIIGMISEEIGMMNVPVSMMTKDNNLILGSNRCSHESPGIYWPIVILFIF